MQLRRPPGEGTVANRVILAFAILIVPWLVNAQQQQNSRNRFESPHEGVKSDVPTVEATRLRPAHQLETPLIHERGKRTVSVENNQNNDEYDASAIATLAPADPAVRAPPARRSSIPSAGLSSPQDARSLADWEVEDFVLLATVDGKLHARDRKTGKERWTLEVTQAMVDIVHHRRNRSAVEEDHRPVDDYVWIVEPNSDGNVFVYVPGGAQPGLVNTGLTMKKLVEMSPYSDMRSSIAYTGEKRTTMITLDAKTGLVLKSFGPGGALVNGDQSCHRPSGFGDTDNEECSSSGTLTLGRTEYTVNIQRMEGENVATLKYSEWGPNNYDQDLHHQHRDTLDGKYVFSRHDGSVFAYDLAHKKEPERRLFRQKFTSPVARVFDVARPLGTEDKDPELVVLPQPAPPNDAEDFGISRNSRIFVNHTEEGSWYAMSGRSYPQAIDGPEQAQCDKPDYWQHGAMWGDFSDEKFSKALIGLHNMKSVGAERLLTISSPSRDDPENETFILDPEPVADHEPETIVERIGQLPRVAGRSFLDFVNNPILTVVIIGILLIYWKDMAKWVRRNYKAKLQPILESKGLVEEAPEPMKIGAPLEVGAEPEKVAEILAPEIENIYPELPSVNGGADVKAAATDQATLTDASADNTPEVPADAPLATPKKKKTHRGQRGGVKHKKTKDRSLSEDSGTPKPPATVEDAVRDAKKLGETRPIEPDILTVQNGVAEVSGPILRLSNMEVNTDKLIGTGSNGTMVFEGKFDGRDVAVKRMLEQFYDIASQETKLLRESDDHPNVIRYYAQQTSGQFLYIALELCPASLSDVIEKPHLHRDLAQSGEKDLPNVLYQITNGVSHLHSLRIVHRDLKPQNILVSMGKDGRPRLLVSDFGLCKKLEGEQSSFRATTAHAAGTSGWRAPELLLDDDARDGHTMIDASTHSSGSNLINDNPLLNTRRATRAIDIFSLGLVFFYVLTQGRHPFDCGDRYMREVNIRKNNYNLRPLEVLGDFAHEAEDLIGSMLDKDPRRRPTARQVMAHPFFWSAKKRLNFLCDVSDHFEKEKRDPPSLPLIKLEEWAPDVCRGDFLKPLGKEFVDSMGKQRKYTGTRLLDLLRALRNKKNHYEDMSDKLKKDVGPLPEGYLSFWTRRFPNLLIACWNIVYDVRWESEDRFVEYYTPQIAAANM